MCLFFTVNNEVGVFVDVVKETPYTNKAVPVFVVTNIVVTMNGPTPLFKGAVLLNGL